MKYGYRQQRQERTEVLKATKTDGLPLDIKDKLLQPLGDQLNLILTQSKCQMTINFQGSWHCAICQYLLVREFENNERNEMAREHFETVNEKSSSEQFYSRTQCDSTSLPSRLPWQDVKMKTSRCCLSWLTDLGPVTCGSRQRQDRTEVLRTTKPDGLPLELPKQEVLADFTVPWALEVDCHLAFGLSQN